MKDKQIQIVIIGAGYAGVMTAVRLSGKVKREKNVSITLVNGSSHFTERPRLHEIATGKRPEPRPLVEMLAGTAVQFRQGWVTALQTRQKLISVQTPAGEEQIAYDYLVYAVGSQVDRDSVPGVREWAYSLDATGERTAAPLHKRLQKLAATGGRVLVVGSGPTGIEVAGEVHDTYPKLDVSIVTAGEFGSFTIERVRQKMRQGVDRLGIKVTEHAHVKEVCERELHLENGEAMPFDICVWAGGFKGPSLARRFERSVEAHERLVESFLRAVEAGDIDSLTELLAEDVILWTDGGGKVFAALNPIEGRRNAIRFIIGSQRFASGQYSAEKAMVNGRQAVLLRYEDGRVFLVINLETDENHIRAFHIVGNPDKLKGVG